MICTCQLCYRPTYNVAFQRLLACQAARETAGSTHVGRRHTPQGIAHMASQQLSQQWHAYQHAYQQHVQQQLIAKYCTARIMPCSGRLHSCAACTRKMMRTSRLHFRCAAPLHLLHPIHCRGIPGSRSNAIKPRSRVRPHRLIFMFALHGSYFGEYGSSDNNRAKLLPGARQGL